MKRFLILILIAVTNLLYAKNKIGFATIYGEAISMKNGDSIVLYTYEYGPINQQKLNTRYSAIVKHNSFCFHIPFRHDRPVYFNIEYNSPLAAAGKPKNEYAVYLYLLEQNDNVKIVYGTDGITFSGTGAQKMQVVYQLRKRDYTGNKNYTELLNKNYTELLYVVPTLDSLKELYEEERSLVGSQINYIESAGKNISAKAKAMLEADVVSQLASTFFLGLKSNKKVPGGIDELAGINDLIGNIVKNKGAAVVAYSWSFPRAVIFNYLVQTSLIKRDVFRFSDVYKFINLNYRGILRESLFATLFTLYSNGSYLQSNDADESVSFLLRQAISESKNPQLSAYLKEFLYSRLNVGVKLRNYSFTDENGNTRKLRDFKNKVVFIDYWFTGCGACREMAPRLKVVESGFSGNKDIVFLTISPDEKLGIWKNSVQSMKYTNPGNINLYTQGLGTNHPFIKDLDIQSGPTLILIDKKGRLFKNFTSPHFDDGKDLTAKINEALSAD